MPTRATPSALQTAAPAARAAAAQRRGAARRRVAQRHRPRLSRLLAWLLAAWLGHGGLALAQVGPGALPTGGQVVVGSGQLQQSGNLLLVQQNSNRLGIDWLSFNIGSGATVEFRQPGASSVALNRVVGNSSTEIYGQLKANGQVFLTNPSGVLFAPGAKVDVGGLVASTLDLSQQDFADGRYVFTAGSRNGAVVNQGSLQARAGGYLALFGNQVSNQGDISVPGGSVVLASGRAATVSISGSGLISAVVTPATLQGSVDNSGRISADGGFVTLSAKSAQDIAASLVNNSGIIRANTLVERGGEIWITGDNVANSGKLSAAAPTGGDGGRIMVLGDMNRGSAMVGGTLDASSTGGAGGFVETSAARVTVGNGTRVNTTASRGQAGTWLIDPVDFTIAASGGDISGATLSSNLGGGDITIASTAGTHGGTAGDVNVNDVVSWSANKLTLNAQNNININAAMIGSGTARLALEYGQQAVAAGNTSTYNVAAPVTLPSAVNAAGPTFTTKLGSNGVVTSYTVIGDLAALQGLDNANLAGNYVLGANITADPAANGGLGFNPIGNETTYTGTVGQYFSGQFDGLGHSIAGLTVARPGANVVGLFASARGASIRNLTLDGGALSGGQYVGAVVGYADTTTTLYDVNSSASVSAVYNAGAAFAGGLVGRFEGNGSGATGAVLNGGSSGAVLARSTSGSAYAGGVVGYVTRAQLSGLVGSGNVSTDANGAGSGSHFAGGVVGITHSSIGISGSLASGTVTSPGIAGGLAGAFDGGGDISSSRAIGAVAGGSAAGGLVGRSGGNVTGVAGVYTASGNVTGTGSVGGLVGLAQSSGAFTDVSAKGDVTGAAGSGRVGGLIGDDSSGGISGAKATGTVTGGQSTGGLVGYFSNAGSISNSRAEGNVFGSLDVGGLVGNANGAGSLTGGVATGAVSASLNSGSVGGLVGYFNLATGLSGSDASGDVSGGANTGGLVGYYVTSAALSSSRGLGAAVIGGRDWAGGLVGYSNASTITGSTATASVTGSGVAGGLAGRTGGNVTGLAGTTTASGSVVGASDVGGLVGRAESNGVFTDVKATGDVTGGSNVGGLLGQATGSVTSGMATGSVTNTTANGSAGGLVGNMSGGIVNSSAGAAATTVSGGTYTGGVVGYYNSSIALVTDGSHTVAFNGASVSGGAWVGGIAGQSVGTAALTGLSVSAAVSATGNAGGLAGYAAGPVSGSSASGAVTGTGYVGGLVGQASGGISNSSAAGTVTNTTAGGYVGGLVGYVNSGSVTSSTAIGAVSGGYETGGLVGTFGGSGNITASSASGAVTITSAGDAGGLVGYASGSGTLSNSSATGNVMAPANADSVGGLAGEFYMTGGIVNSSAGAAASTVSGGNYTGGVVGYYSTAAALVTDSVAGTAVTFKGASVSGGSWVGGIAGQSVGTAALTGLSASAAVTATGTAGGLAGSTAGAVTLSNASGAVTAGSTAGGLVGVANGSGAYTDVYAIGPVQGSTAGGLVGNYNSTGAITRGHATGQILATSVGGGLVGNHGGGTVADSYATGNVSGVSDSTVYLGGLIGYYGASCYYCGNAAYVISNSTASGAVRTDSSASYLGGLVGLMFSGSITNSHTFTTSTVTATDSVNGTGSSHYTGGLVGYFGYYSNSGSINGNSYASGAVAGGYFAGGLVGSFQGTSINDSSASGAVSGKGYVGGLVGYSTQYGSSTNVSSTGAVSTAAGSNGSYVGGLFGYLNLSGGGLSSGFASGNVSAPSASYVGGLAGYISGSSSVAAAVNDSSASGTVSGGSYAGGLVGYYYNYYGYSPLLNSHATGAVTGSTYAGGLVGGYYRYTTTGAADDITNTYATGTASGSNYVGGLVGDFQGRKGLVGSYASGNVVALGSSGTMYLGGLVGNYYGYHTSAAATAPLTASYATGSVTLAPTATVGNGTTVYAGGLVGYLDGAIAALPGIVDSYATGAVSLNNVRGRFYAGGLVGWDNNQNIVRTYATGAVAATNGNSRATGGLVAGRSSGTVTDSYWNTATTGQASSLGGGTGVGSAALLQAATFANWSIATTGSAGQTWRMYQGYTNPLLTRFLTPLALTLADASKVYDGTTSFGNASLSNASGPVSFPDRIYTAAPSADVGSYALAAAGVYSVQNGYDLTVQGSSTLTVTPRSITLAGIVADKVYDATRTATLVGTAQPQGLVAGEDLAVNLSSATATFDTKDAGQNKAVTVSGLTLGDGSHGKASNYALVNATSTTASITPLALNVGGFTATNRTYDGSTTVAVSAGNVAVSGLLGDDVTVNVASVNSGTMATKDVGTAKPVTVLGATLSGADAGNYTIGGINTVTVNITPRTLTVNGITATDREYDRTVNVTVSTNTATLSGAVAGDAVQLQRISLTGTVATKDVAYDAGGTVTTKAVSVAGSGLKLRGTDAGNYTVANATTTVTIQPQTLYFYVGTNNQTNKVYDGTTSASVSPYTYSYYWGSNAYGGDSVTLSYATPAYSDKNVAYSNGVVTSKTITVSGATLSGADALNFRLNNTSATASGTISPLALTVTGVLAKDRSYDGTRNVSVDVANAQADVSKVVAGDIVSVTLPGSGTVVGTMVDKNVGTAKAVTVPGFTLSGTDAGNYSLTGNSGVTVNITKKDLTVAYVAADKVYDGNAYAAISATSADIVTGDKVFFYADQGYCTYCGYGYFVTPTSTPASYTLSKDAAVGKTVVVTANSMYGADAGNYNLLNPTATLTATISPKGITPVFTGVNKVYDGTTAATVTLNANASGVVGGDAVSLSRTATFDTKNVGNGKSVAITDIAFSGASASNYTLATNTASTTASITPATLSVQGVAATDRAYDGTTSVALVAGAVAAAGVIGNDQVGVVVPGAGLGSGTIANKNVGSNKPVTVSGLTLNGADAGNYVLDGSQGVSVNITARPLTVSYVGVDRVYNGGIAAQVTGSSADLVAGDTLSYTQNAVFTGLDARNVGSNKPIGITGIVIGGADAANYSLLNSTASATASITPKGITVAYTGLSRVYDGMGDTSANVLGSSAGLVAGDFVTFTQTARFDTDGAAGDGKAVTVSNIALAGAQAANYSLLSTTASTTASISKRPIGVVGVTATNRVYDGTRVVSVNTTGATTDLSGVIAGDHVDVLLPAGGITTGTVATKDAGNNKDVTITGLTLTGSSASNYIAAGASGLTVNITPRLLAALYTAADKIYDGTAAAVVSATSSDILALDTGALGINASGSFSAGKNAGTGKTVAVTGAFLTGAERNNYTLLNPNGTTTASITPKTLTATYSGGTRVYDGGVAAPVTALNAGVIAGDVLGFAQTAVFTGAGAKNVGSGKAVAISNIALTGADAGNYALAATTAATTASVTPKPISIDGLTGASATDRVYDGTRAVAVTVTTSGAITPSSHDIVGNDVVQINLPAGGVTTGTMTDKNAGQSKPLVVDGLSLTGADAGNYFVTATTGVTVNIAPKPLTAAYTGISKVYDGTAAASVTGTSADILGGDVVAIAGGGLYTGVGAKNVGAGKAVSVTSGTLSGTDAANYALVNPTGTTTAGITPRPITPVFTGLSKVYDGTTVAQVSSDGTFGFIAGDAVVLSETATFTGGKNVGQGKAIVVGNIGLAGADTANYTLLAGNVNTTGSITPKPLRIDGLTGVAAVDRVYDGTNVVAVQVSASGPIAPNAADLIAGDVVTVTAPGNGTTIGTMADKGVGSAKPVNVAGLSLGGADAANYSITATSGVTVNITPRPVTATYTAGSRVYDGTTAASITGSSGDFVVGDAVTIVGTGVFTGVGAKNVGSGKAVAISSITFGGADAANYSLLNPTGTTTGSITPRSVTVTYTGGSRVYDGSTAAPVAASAAGFITGDSVLVSQTAVFSGAGAKNVGTGKAVDVSGITLGGADAVNYALVSTTASTTGTITPKPLRIDGFSGVVATDRVYDGTTAVAITIQGSGTIAVNAADLVAGDVVGVVPPASGATAGTIADKNVGSNKPVTVAGLTLNGADAGNYIVAAAAGVTVNITPRPLTATYTALDKVYDGTAAAAITGASADVIFGDLVTIGGTGLFTGSGAKNVGAGKTVAISAGSLGGADAGNYSLLNTLANTTASITPKALTATYTGGTRVYDGTTGAPVTLDAIGLIAGDLVGLSQTAVFIGVGARNAGVNKPVQVSGIALTGSDAANYQLTANTAVTTATITPRPLNVSGLAGLQAVDRVYDGTRDVQITGTAVVGAASGDIVAGDSVTITLPSGSISAGTMVDKSAGLGKSVVVAGLGLSGADAANYQITGTAGLTVNIAPRPVVLLGVSAVDRGYDGTTVVAINSAGGSISGKVAGDELSLLSSGVTGTMADKHVGNGKAVSVSGLSLAGADAANYTVVGGGLTVNITPRTLLASASAADRPYDGSIIAAVTLADNRVAGDQLTLIGSGATFATKDAGATQTVTVAGLSLSGADAGDYVLASNALSTTARIVPAAVTVSGAALSKVYGDAVTLTGAEFSASAMAPGEFIGLVSLTSAGTAAGAAVAGSPYALVASKAQGGNFNPSNYAFSYASGTVTVTPRPVTVAANSVVRTVSEPNPASFGFSVSDGGLINGDTITSASIAAPAGSDRAPAFSIYELLPGGAVFGQGQASNYAVSYSRGLLVVLPNPPQPGDNNGAATQGFAVQLDVGERERALAALESAQSLYARAAQPAPRGDATPAEMQEASAADLEMVLAGDSSRITLPALQRLPLISYDPSLRRLILGAPSPRESRPASTTTP